MTLAAGPCVGVPAFCPIGDGLIGPDKLEGPSAEGNDGPGGRCIPC